MGTGPRKLLAWLILIWVGCGVIWLALMFMSPPDMEATSDTRPKATASTSAKHRTSPPRGNAAINPGQR